MSSPRPPGLFVTGTDTNVGKTLVTAAFARYLVKQGLPVGVMKPIETGVSPEGSDPDHLRLAAAASVVDPSYVINPYRFTAPLAPLAAAREERRSIELATIVEAFGRLKSRYAPVLVEGVGGVMVPLGAEWDVRDLMVKLELPVLIVGRAELGGINHALMTEEAVRQRGVAIVAILLNHPASPRGDAEHVRQVNSTVALLRERSLVPVLGPVPFEARAREHWMEAIEALSAHPVFAELAGLLRQART